jgi:hypothetical protein
MGCLKLLIAEIAAYYSNSVERVFFLCNQLLIAYEHHHNRLELEGMQVIIYQLLSVTHTQRFTDNN